MDKQGLKTRILIIMVVSAFIGGGVYVIGYQMKTIRQLDKSLEEKTARLTELTVEIMRREQTKIGQSKLRVLKAEVLRASIELNSGYVVKAKVRNIGEAGFITVFARLNSNEGTWSKTRKQYFLEGEERDEIFIFLEPSFWVEDIQAVVGEEELLRLY